MSSSPACRHSSVNAPWGLDVLLLLLDSGQTSLIHHKDTHAGVVREGRDSKQVHGPIGLTPCTMNCCGRSLLRPEGAGSIML